MYLVNSGTTLTQSERLVLTGHGWGARGKKDAGKNKAIKKSHEWHRIRDCWLVALSNCVCKGGVGGQRVRRKQITASCVAWTVLDLHQADVDNFPQKQQGIQVWAWDRGGG